MQQTILDNLTTAVFALDDQLRVLYLNTAAEALMDVSFNRVQGLPVTDFVWQEELPADLVRTLEKNYRFTRRETICQTHDETLVTVDYTITPVVDGNVVLLLEIHPRDRLRKISREEALMTKQETSKELIRGLAHEIKNPLGGIRGAAQLLARELREQELDEFTGIIIKEADRLRDLVDRMLGPLKPPRMNNLNIHEITERVIQIIEAETVGQITICRDYDPSIPDFPGDSERLIQALLNIVRNAMQAIEQVMPLSEGQIKVRTRILRQFTIGTQPCRLVCHLAVIDNGPGIPENLIDSIFYPMISGRANGTGLGLPLTQSIISEHKGLVECESQPGQTLFNVYLPLDQAMRQKDVINESISSSHGQTGVTQNVS